MEEHYSNIEKEDSFNIKEFIFKNIRYWKLYSICLIVSILIATFLNEYTPPVYKTSVRILIREDENPLETTPTSIPSLYGNPYRIDNEIGILHSKELTRRTLSNLNFELSYYKEKHFLSEEIYKKSPFIIEYDVTYPQPMGVKFYLSFLNDTTIRIHSEAEKVAINNYLTNSNLKTLDYFRFEDTLVFGELTGNEYCRFRIVPNLEYSNTITANDRYSFKFYSFNELINNYRNFDIETSSNSSIITISLKCYSPEKGVDFLNKFTEIYLFKGIERDMKIAESTLDFIDNQLKDISDSLELSEENLQDFRSTKKLLNVDFQTQKVYEKFDILQSKQADLLIKLKYYNYLKTYLKENNAINDLIAPSSLDINDQLLTNLLVELSNLYKENTELSYNSIKKNPYQSTLEFQIQSTKEKLIESIDNLINTSEISLSDLNKRITEIESSISNLPMSERELLGIERRFNLNDELYTFLLKKRSEIQITKASNIPSNEILDEASLQDTSIVKPGTRTNYILALILGLLIPVALIYLRDIFRDKIQSKKDIQQYTHCPLTGYIIKNRNKSNLIVHEQPNSIIAESFRSLRTNFQFIAAGKQNKTILVTSIDKGEGKSFISINLATVFAQNHKKVILLDFDLRKSKIKEYMEIKSDLGLSSYLADFSTIKDIIVPSVIENLDIIIAGIIPPNPTELIASEKTKKIITYLKKEYDYIIIDSPPVGLVSDALLIVKHVDINLFVVRQNYTSQTLFSSVMDDIEKNNVQNINIILNDVSLSNTINGYNYGYGYGYGYGNGDSRKEKTLIKKISDTFSTNSF